MNMQEAGSLEQVVIALCRPGFESDAFDELSDRVGGEVKEIKTLVNQGYLRASPVARGKLAFSLSEKLLERKNPSASQLLVRTDRGAAAPLQMPAEGFVFVWDLLLGYLVHFPRDSKDRVSAILQVLERRRSFQNLGGAKSVASGPTDAHESREVHAQDGFGSRVDKPAPPLVRVCCAEASPVAGLVKFTKKLEVALVHALARSGATLLTAAEELVVFFESYESAVVVVRPIRVSNRLARRGRVARSLQAPSRSGSKLAEAFRFFDLPSAAGGKAAAAQRWAVDLGAAPGGWTKVLLENGYRVLAIDNGPLDASLKPYFAAGRLVHLARDAFHFVPEFPVGIVTCDVVDQPTKVTELMKKWGLKGYSNELVFNLKLPMKKRYHSVKSCLGELAQALFSKGFAVSLDAHQLYHDRQEVTVRLSIDRVKETI